MSAEHIRLPRGSLILVTGATGLVGSAVTEELVKKGYKVRAATRDVAKTKLFSEKLDKLYGDGFFETVEIQDFAAPGAYDKALEGVVGVVHVASDVSLSPNVDQVVGNAVNSTVGILKAATAHPQIKSFVLTSSRVAVYYPQYGQDGEYPLTTFSDYFYDMAKSAPADDPRKPVLTYAASKVKAERAAWAFVDEHKPSFAFNTILPDYVMGPPANPAKGFYSTSTGAVMLFNGDSNSITVGFSNPSSNMVDVRDVAIIHVAALLATDVDHERLWAAAHPYHINDLLRIWREAYPDRKDKIPGDFDFAPSPKQKVDTSKSVELLHRFAGRSWLSLETSVLDTVKGFEE